MASIQFTDSAGAATLQSSWPAPANRFRSWEPDSEEFGEAAHKLSDGQHHRFAFRTDYWVSLEIPGIANTDVDIALRFMRYIRSDGATCTVNTGDASSRSYATCCLKPGTAPELRLEDRVMLEYVLSVTLLNVAASPTDLLCEY